MVKSLTSQLAKISSFDVGGMGAEGLDIPYYIPSSILGLNALITADIYKGFPATLITQISGPPGCGKTRIAVDAAQNCQAIGGEVFWIDTERAMTQEGLMSDKLDPERMFVGVCNVAEEVTIELRNMLGAVKKMRDGGDNTPLLVVVDSIGNLMSMLEVSQIEGGEIKADPGRRAQAIKQIFRASITPVLAAKVVMIVINHEYTAIGEGKFAANKQSGGHGTVYLSSITISMTKAQEKEDTLIVGANMKMQTTKNRLARERQKMNARLFFDTGFNPYVGLLPYAIEAGAIVKKDKKFIVPHIDAKKTFWEKSLYREEVFTPELLKEIAPVVTKFFAYGSEEISSAAVEMEQEALETEVLGDEDN